MATRLLGARLPSALSTTDPSTACRLRLTTVCRLRLSTPDCRPATACRRLREMETRQGVVSPTEVAEATSGGSADRREKRPSRPFGLSILTLALLGSPVIHAGALLLRTRWLNFGSLRLWDGLVYFLIAPIVGVLMLRRHERARFSAYVFLSCEVLRALRIHSPTLGLIAVGFLFTCNSGSAEVPPVGRSTKSARSTAFAAQRPSRRGIAPAVPVRNHERHGVTLTSHDASMRRPRT